MNKISFSSWGSQSETTVIKELISEYEKQNNIKIDFIHIPQNYFQKIQLLFASGLEPDVVFFNNQNIQMYIKSGLIEDLNSYFDNKEFYKEALNCFKKGDKLYAIPRDISILVLYYNKDIMKKYSINPQDIKDLNSLVNVLQKIKDKNIFGINFESDSLYWSYYLAATGGGILTDDSKNLLITSKESINTLQLYSDMINKYHIMPTKAQIGSRTSAQMFINGELAMYLSGRWMVPKFRETINFDWDIMMFPISDNEKVYSDASGWAVSKNSKNKDEAIKFIKFLSSEYSIRKIAQTGLIVPANKKAAEYTIENDIKPQHSRIFLDIIEKTKPTPVNANYAAINDIINERVESIFSGHLQAKDVIDAKTKQKLERILK